MMQRCSNMVGPCTCGLFHSHPNSFSMLFNPLDLDPNINAHYYYNSNSNSNSNIVNTSSSVDCTLSLAPPSARLISDDHRRSTFFRHPTKPSRSSSASDPLLARRCSNCDTTSTPLWRNGPRGPKSLCNACGIRFKKEERRASAAAASGGSEHQHVFGNKAQKMACYSPAGNDFRFGDDGDSFLSWRLDMPGLVVHDFTRS